MVGLSLPRLHKDVPKVVASPEGEALLLDFLTQRVHAKLPLPDLDESKPMITMVSEMLTSQFSADCDRMAALDGRIAIENKAARDADDGDDGWNDNEITLSYAPFLNGVFHIGLALQRLEMALPGAAETVMAWLDAANEAAMYPLALPSIVRDMALSYSWAEVPPDAIEPVVIDGVEDYAAADAVVQQWYEEFYEGFDDSMLLPSGLYKEMKGPFAYSAVFKPKVKVQLTEQAFLDAGFDLALAADLVLRLEVELPELVKNLKVLRRKHLMFTSSFGVAAAIVTLGDESTRAVDLVDEIVNDRFSSGAPDHVLRISTSPVVRRKQGKWNYVDTAKRVDGVGLFADYINLLGHMDKILVALCQ